MKNFIFLSLVHLVLINPAAAAPWNLPVELTGANTHVFFTVDSTWHTVHGTVQELKGRAWLEHPQDPGSVHLTVSMPVSGFETGDADRDEKMREVMHAKDAPTVDFSLIEGIGSKCTVAEVTEAHPCSTSAIGVLTINNVQKPIPINLNISKNGSDYVVKGSASLNWAEYNVEDPSILIARLSPKVDIEFLLTLASIKG